MSRRPDYTDYESVDIHWGNGDDYDYDYGVETMLISRRNYHLYEGLRFSDKIKVLIKIYKPEVEEKQIKKEIKILQILSGGPNVARLLDVVRDHHSGAPNLIFEYVNNTEFRALCPTLSADAIIDYSFQLLRAVEYAHSQGIMNRDVNPETVFIDPCTGKVCLMDWGQAEFYCPAQKYITSVGSKGPELVYAIEEYDYSVDLWSVGCIIADMASGLVPFFAGKNDSNEMIKTARAHEFFGPLKSGT